MMDKDLKMMILKKLMGEMDAMEGSKLKKPKAMEVSLEAKELDPMEAKEKLSEVIGESEAPVEIEMEASEDCEDEDLGGESSMMQKLKALRKSKKMG